MKKFILFFLLSLLLTCSAVYAADLMSNLDLSNYPNHFISNSRLDVTFVVGEFADTGDVLALVEIANSLQYILADYDNPNVFELDIKGSAKDELTELYMDVFNKKTEKAAKTTLDTSLNLDKMLDQNLIVVGGPCVNWIAAHFLGNPKECDEGFYEGRAHMQLFRNGKGVVLLIAGYSVDDTRMGAHILANYKDFSANLNGDRVSMSSAWIDRITIK